MPVITVDDDRDVLERAWGLVTLPMGNEAYAANVRELLDDGQHGVCPRALQMFELAVEIAAMNGTLAMLVAAWARGQLFAPCRRHLRRRADTIPGTRKGLQSAAHDERGVQMSIPVTDVCQ